MFAIIAVLAVALLGTIGIAAATLSQTLTVNGTATVKATNWKVQFQSISNATVVGKAKEITAPTVQTGATTIGTYDVTLQMPGDSVAYDIVVENAGDIDAKVTGVTINTGSGLTCKLADNTDAASVCANLDYTLTNADGSAVKVNDELQAGTTKTITLKLAMKSDMTQDELPTSNVTVGNLGVSIVYGQAE